MSRDPGIWTAALLTLAVWSYLYKQNVVFQAVEHVFIGISAAHAMTVAFRSIASTAVRPLLRDGDLGTLFPLAAGLLLYARFTGRFSWLSRIPLGFTMGTAAAVAIRGSIDASLVKQVQATMLPLVSADNILVVTGTVAVLVYFLFNRKGRAGVLRPISAYGRYVIMAAFGAAYGNTVMMRISLLIPRMRLVFGAWLGISKH